MISVVLFWCSHSVQIYCFLSTNRWWREAFVRSRLWRVPPLPPRLPRAGISSNFLIILKTFFISESYRSWLENWKHLFCIFSRLWRIPPCTASTPSARRSPPSMWSTRSSARAAPSMVCFPKFIGSKLQFYFVKRNIYSSYKHFVCAHRFRSLSSAGGRDLTRRRSFNIFWRGDTKKHVNYVNTRPYFEKI